MSEGISSVAGGGKSQKPIALGVPVLVMPEVLQTGERSLSPTRRRSARVESMSPRERISGLLSGRRGGIEKEHSVGRAIKVGGKWNRRSVESPRGVKYDANDLAQGVGRVLQGSIKVFKELVRCDPPQMSEASRDIIEKSLVALRERYEVIGDGPVDFRELIVGLKRLQADMAAFASRAQSEEYGEHWRGIVMEVLGLNVKELNRMMVRLWNPKTFDSGVEDILNGVVRVQLELRGLARIDRKWASRVKVVGEQIGVIRAECRELAGVKGRQRLLRKLLGIQRDLAGLVGSMMRADVQEARRIVVLGRLALCVGLVEKLR